jgi:hypothetical protein
MRHSATSLLACSHAAAARFCADAAMLVHVSVTLEFLPAYPADCRASVKHSLDDLFI